MIPPYATGMWSKDSNVCVEKFLGQQIYLSIFSTVNLNISICLPTFKKEPRNSKHLMSTSKASFQQIANSGYRVLVKLFFIILRVINPYFCENSQIIVLVNHREMCRKFATVILYQRNLEMKYHGNTELVFFLHRTEIPPQQKQPRWKSRKININNINNSIWAT